MKLLFEWDELRLSDTRRDYFADKESYCSFMSGYTRPIRMPDEWSEADWKEYRGWLGVGQSKINQEVAVKIFEIATRIPVDPWDELDKVIEDSCSEHTVIYDLWQKLKESRDE